MIPEEVSNDLSEFYPWLIKSRKRVRFHVLWRHPAYNVEGVVTSKNGGEIVLLAGNRQNVVIQEAQIMCVQVL